MESSSSQAMAHIPDKIIIRGDLMCMYGAARGACVGNAEFQETRRFPTARSLWIELPPSIARDSVIGKDTWERGSDGLNVS